MHYKNITKCRMCGNENLQELLKFDPQYISTTFVKDNDTHPNSKIKIPMTLLLCEKCKLVQLRETVNPDLMYFDYFYRSGTTQKMKKDLKDVADCAIKKVGINSDSVIIDIGCNDGTILKMYPSFVEKIGVDPAKNIVRTGLDNKTKIICDYFSKEVLEKEMNGRKAKIISSEACFYDFDNPVKGVQDIKHLLEPDGVCVIQVSSLLDTIKDMNFYDIVMEHTLYYSLHSLDYLMSNNGMQIYDVSTNDVNGGSIRIYCTHKENRKIKSTKYHEIMHLEDTYKIHDIETYKHFEQKIKQYSDITKKFIKDNGLVLGLGASTKGAMLLQLFGIDKTMMPYISDRSDVKIGLKTLGTDIPLISEQDARDMKPGAMICFPWNFKQEILGREKEYIENGGKLMFIMPEPYYIDKFGEHLL